MDRIHLQNYISSLLPMPIEKAQFFANQFELIELQKNEFLLEEYKISKSTFVLEEGYIRSFTFDAEGEEVTTNIFSPTCFVNDFLSFFKQQKPLKTFNV